MMTWAVRRRIAYGSAVFGVTAVLLGTYLYFALYQPPTCSDGKQNQDELGVDCGGRCAYLCPFQVSAPIVEFARSFESVPGTYSAIAYINNKNFNAAVYNVGYVFKFYDASNTLIGTRKGTTFIISGGVTPVFETGIDLGGAKPARTFFEFTDIPRFKRVVGYTENPLKVTNRGLENPDTHPKITGTLENTSLSTAENIEVVATVFNALGNAVATSHTVVDSLAPGASQDIVFTWPTAFAKTLEVCSAPINASLLLDVSGSMNNDSINPPQPLTDAKNAAKAFLDRLSQIDRASIVSFATTAHIGEPLSADMSAAKAALDALSILPAEEHGSTNIGDAIRLGIETLQNDTTAPRDSSLPKVRSVIVLLTDGRANAPSNPGGEPYAESEAAVAKKDGFTLYTIGLGSDVNETFLKAVASDPSQYYHAATRQELDAVYKKISEAVCERGVARIDILPKTPSLLAPATN